MARLLLRGASTIYIVEAATLLVIKTSPLLDALVLAGLVKEDREPFHSAHIEYEQALAQLYDGTLELGSIDAAMLEISASLARNCNIGLPSTLGRGLDRSAVVRIAEAILFSLGYMDPTIDPVGGHGPDQAGPNELAHYDRF